MFISHDLATVRAVCDEVMILYAGQMMERGPGGVVMQAPQHPYADLLASSIPELRPGWLDGIDATRLAEARGEAARPGPVRSLRLRRALPGARPGRAKSSRRRCGASPRAPTCTAIARSRSFWRSNPRAPAPP